jgi:hypothetical protein
MTAEAQNLSAYGGPWTLSGFSMPLEMDFYAAGYQPFPAALTSSRQYRSPAFGFHARAEPELALPGAFRRLICSFHLSKS